MARKLFGTDGIRGVAGEYPLDDRTVYAAGAALGKWVAEGGRERHVLIGMDTRESGAAIAAEVAGGLASQGVEASFAGVTTTPGVAYLAKTGPFSAGVMISASHNPYRDNGIKVLGHSGYKLPDAEEENIETEMFRLLENGVDAQPAQLRVDDDLDRDYVRHLASTMTAALTGLNVVLDCANGSASELAPDLFSGLRANVRAIHNAPNGSNINRDCGSLHLESLRSTVLQTNADVGVAFDGDADRALFISRSGKMVDGDAVLLMTARHLKKEGRLAEADGREAVVATVMSNLGLERALRALDIELVRTPVGDKYVLEEMLRRGARLGGEQSGHIIFRDYATTGDGMLTALRVLEIMSLTSTPLDELAGAIEVYPQVLVNVRVKQRRPLEELPAVQREIRSAESDFGDRGRVLVRFSGTEPLARVMVEGEDRAKVDAWSERIAGALRSELGS